MRKDWDSYFMEMVDMVGSRATCPRKHVGAILVKDKKILSTGYNGSPHGLEHCEDIGCMIVDNHCIRTIHAEMNALLQAGKEAKGSILYCNCIPCAICFKLCIQMGVTKIVYSEDYKSDEAKYWIDSHIIDVVKW